MQNGESFDEKMPRPSATGSSKISFVDGDRYMKACPTTGLPSLQPLITSQNDTTFTIFELAATILVPTGLLSELTSISDNHYSKPSTETKANGLPEHTQYFGQNGLWFVNEWVALLTSQLQDYIPSSLSTSPKPPICNPLTIRSF